MVVRRAWDFLGTVRAGNIAIVMVFVMTLANGVLTASTGRDIAAHLLTQTVALEQLVAAQPETLVLLRDAAGRSAQYDERIVQLLEALAVAHRDSVTGSWRAAAGYDIAVRVSPEPGETPEDYLRRAARELHEAERELPIAKEEPNR